MGLTELCLIQKDAVLFRTMREQARDRAVDKLTVDVGVREHIRMYRE